MSVETLIKWAKFGDDPLEHAWVSEQNEKILAKIKSRNVNIDIRHEGVIKDVERLDENEIRTEIFTAMKHYIQRNHLRAVDVFSQWDANGKDVISREQFVKSVHQFLPMRIHKFKMDLLLSWQDPKNTGVINYRDFLQIVREYQPPALKKCSENADEKAKINK